MRYSSEATKNIHLQKSTGELDNSFVGIKIIGDDIFIHYPECYPMDKTSPSFSDDVLSLLSTFSLAGSQSAESSVTYVGDTGGEFRLEAYLWVIRDFLNRGFYVNTEKVYGLNQKGKVNWKRTFHQKPVISGKNVVYTDLITEKRVITDNIVVEIHKYCVKKSLNFIGWLFNLDGSFIDILPMTGELKTYYNYVLQEELQNTFDDYKKELFSNLIFVLNGLSDYDTKQVISYGVDQYYYIFERMIDKIFGNVKAKEFYPKGYWELNGNVIESSSLRPDTIMEDEDNIYIIDSKYYRYGYTGEFSDLPETSSIQKQIAYGEYAHKLHRGMNVYNAFIIPYDKTNNQLGFGEDVVYIGKAYSSTSRQNKTFHYIHSFLIDLNHVIKTYNRANRYADRTILVTEIRNIAAEGQYQTV